MITTIIDNGIEHKFVTYHYKGAVYCIMDYDFKRNIKLDVDEETFHRRLKENFTMKTEENVNIKSESYIISELSKEDLEERGFDTSNISEETMKKLASKLGDDYCENLFWTSLDIIAESMNIPKKKL